MRQHALAVAAAVLAGIIYGGPHIWFVISNKDIYQGIPMIHIANEDFYLARVQEIINGHYTLGSQGYYEYKDQLPLSPPTGEFIYALPTLIFGMSLTATLLAANFIFPLILFLLIYALFYRLASQDDKLTTKVTAVAVGTFVTLGYDLVDYRTVWSYLTGANHPSQWLIWSRPVNPILGAIFLFSFILCIWSIVQKGKHPKLAIGLGGIFLALMFASYFFSWGMALSIFTFVGLFLFLKKEYATIKCLALLFGVGLLLSSPYWYISWQAKFNPWYQSSVLRSGLLYTHYPLLNIFLLVTLAVYLAILFRQFGKNFKFFRLENYHLFTLAFLLGGLFAFSQQIITGITIWPFHFVQYTIPLSIVTIFTLLYHYLSARYPLVWKGVIGLVLFASLWFGINTQFVTYKVFLDHNRSVQSYRPVFDWFNKEEKDCVVLVASDPKKRYLLNGMITSFTHCNIYANTWSYSLMPDDRIYHNYLVNIRAQGITGDMIEEYMKQNMGESRAYLSSNWKGLYGVRLFPDFTDDKLPQRLKQFPIDYRKFLAKDFSTELKKYRLDFILSVGPLVESVKKQLPNIELVAEINGNFIYQ